MDARPIVDPPTRAMILAAGLGTRMRPLTDHRAKPALPVRGRPVISLLLAWLARHGIREVLVNLHHRADSIRAAVASDHPDGLDVTWSEEPEPLGTGGGIRRAAEFLRGTPDCVVLAGDMLVDLDLGAMLARHRASGRDVTLVLRDDPRAEDFGSVGLDANGRVVRIGRRMLKAAPGDPARLGEESASALFTSLRFFRREALADWPAGETAAFEDLRDWLAPRAVAGRITLGAERVSAAESVWEPVGTPAEYLAVNLSPPSLPSLGPPEAWSGDLRAADAQAGRIVPRSVDLPADARLERCVVWDGERLPPGFHGRDGVYAGDAFHSCASAAAGRAA